MKQCRAQEFLWVAALAAALALPGCGKTEPPAPAGGTATPETSAAPPSEEPRNSQARDDGSDKFDPAQAVGAVPGVPAPTNSAPLAAVANYFAELPGIELGGLTTTQREKFLQRVNSELCTCGCKNDTLAHCYVNDPRCPVVKGMVRTVLDEVKAVR